MNIYAYFGRIFTAIQAAFPPKVLVGIYIIVAMILFFTITSVRVSSVSIGYEIADIATALVSQEVEMEALRQEYDALVRYERLYNMADNLGYKFNPEGVVDYYPSNESENVK